MSSVVVLVVGVVLIALVMGGAFLLSNNIPQSFTIKKVSCFLGLNYVFVDFLPDQAMSQGTANLTLSYSAYVPVEVTNTIKSQTHYFSSNTSFNGTQAGVIKSLIFNFQDPLRSPIENGTNYTAVLKIGNQQAIGSCTI